MKQYLKLMREILDYGVKRDDRTGAGTLSLFGPQLEFNMSDGFPAMTTKQLMWKSVVKELNWFLSGSTNIKSLGCGIWDQWADSEGNVGPVYGKQWRDWNGIDQIDQLIKGLIHNPESRRHIVSAWNVSDIPNMGLPCCHILFQCYVSEGMLSLKMYQRSADYFIGVPFNIASYALLLCRLADKSGLKADKLIISFGDVHIYLNHLVQCHEQLKRTPLRLPILKGDELEGYKCFPAIKAKINV